MSIKLLLYLYILFVASVSILSYKKGCYLVWLTVLLFPPIILYMETKIKIPFIHVLMLTSVLLELRYYKNRLLYGGFIVQHQKAIFFYFTFTLCIVLMSQTVPILTQFKLFINEIIILLFALQTFLIVTNNRTVAVVLLIMVCCIILFNFLYFLYFEMYLGMNPAGKPLYMALNITDNDFLVDMIDSERGIMDFRAQTVYGHPLSLGQYMLILLPVFFLRNNNIKLVLMGMALILIIASGTRGALVPSILILIIGLIRSTHHLFLKTIIGITIIIVGLSIMPTRTWKIINEQAEPFAAGLMFWDENKQTETNIGGSSMSMRFDQWEAAQDEISNNPLMGRGLGYREWWQTKHNGLHPSLLGYESLLIYYLVERGWLGLILFFLMTFYIYFVFKKKTSTPYILKLIFVGYVISIIMTGVRPFSFLLVCLASSIVCGIYPKQRNLLARG